MVIGAIAGLGGCVASPPIAQNSYPNDKPSIDAYFPDPAALRAPGGYYYIYATQGEVGGKMQNIHIARSRDLTTWEQVGDALPVKPSWASQTQDFGAPHVSRHDGRYYLYYSAKLDVALEHKKSGLCLAVAAAERPEGPFTDIGKPLQCGNDFINIDPMAYDDPATGKRLLYWGSGFGPIKVQELAKDRISLATNSKPVDLVDIIKNEDPKNYALSCSRCPSSERKGYGRHQFTPGYAGCGSGVVERLAAG